MDGFIALFLKGTEMKKIPLLWAVSALSALSALAVTCDTNYVSGLNKSFFITDVLQTEIRFTAGIAFDPTHQTGGIYDRIYLANCSEVNSRRGLYSVDLINETASSCLALAGARSNDLDLPQDVAADFLGNVYVTYGGSPQVWAVEDPFGLSVETRMIGNYGGAGDDDPNGISMVPLGFGGGYAEGRDVLLFDVGFNKNTCNAVSVIDSESTATSTLWKEDCETDFRAAVSDVDGLVYIVHEVLDRAGLNGTTKPYVLQLSGAGETARFFLDMDASEAVRLDDAVAVNPVDGSLWMVLLGNDGVTRNVFRVDVRNAAKTKDSYLASVAPVIRNLDCNPGAYSMAFSPDGKQLVFADADLRDRIYIYALLPEEK
jgi:sugar lactone lactonase YvrE